MKGNVSKSEIIGGKSVTLSQFKEEVMDTVVKEIAEAQALVPTRYYVSELPTDDIDTNGTYLLTSDNGNEKVYNEYANINGEWFLIGGPFKDDFADLYSRSEAQAALELKADKSYVDEKNQTLNNEMSAQLSQKASATDLEAEIEERQAATHELTERINECNEAISTKAEQTDLNSEVSDREAAVAELRTLIETNTANLSDKASASELAEEISNRKDKYNELKTELNTKSDKTALTTEINKREAADALLAADISKKADSTLLDDEVKTRKMADDTLSWRMTEHENGFNHPDGSVTVEKLGDDIMQIINGKAEQSNLSETNEDINDIKNTALFYEECNDIENPPWGTGVFTNSDRSVIVFSVRKDIKSDFGGFDYLSGYYCNQLKLTSVGIQRRYCSEVYSTVEGFTQTQWENLIGYQIRDVVSSASSPKCLADIDKGVYYLKGTFIPYEGSTDTIEFQNEQFAVVSYEGTGRIMGFSEKKYYVDGRIIQVFDSTTFITRWIIIKYDEETKENVFKETIINPKDLETTIESINSDVIDLSNSIDTKIAEAKSIIPKRYIVSELPTTNIDENGTYLVPANEPNTDNIYTEYAYINNAWEIIGSPFEVDLSGYATQNDLTQSHDELKTQIESGLTDLSNEIYTELNTKEDRISIDTVSDTEYSACFNNNVQYRCEELTSLTLNLPDNIPDDYISSVIFTSGATATNLIYPDTIKMLGEDCIDCIFTPVANKRYEVIISYDGVNCVGVVGGYEV